MQFRKDNWHSLVRPGLAEMIASFFLIVLAVGGATTTVRFAEVVCLM